MKFLYALAAAAMAVAPSAAAPVHYAPSKVNTIGLPPSIPAELKSVIFVDEDTSKMDAVDAESRGPRKVAQVEFDMTTFVVPASTDIEVIEALIAKFSPPKPETAVPPHSTEAFMAAYRKEAALRGLHPHYRRPSAHPHAAAAAGTRHHSKMNRRPSHRHRLAAAAAKAKAMASCKYYSASIGRLNLDKVATTWMQLPWTMRFVVWFSMCFVASLMIVASIAFVASFFFGSRLPGSIRLEENDRERAAPVAVAASPVSEKKSATFLEPETKPESEAQE
ncbi:uncharacterized protein BROUX77_004972 [Berkeleyomyces rouxiae]|uniref:uncharacterized protein n=1 Tax=Berkeleyomyces rouxiae TaxID=2035830 RepID=UPI003B82B0F5